MPTDLTDRFGAANCILIRTAPDGTRTMTASADPWRSDDDARTF